MATLSSFGPIVASPHLKTMATAAVATEVPPDDVRGQCHCGKVKFTAKTSEIRFNDLCHCKNCSRARSMTPVHILGVPTKAVEITEGKELLEVRGGGGREGEEGGGGDGNEGLTPGGLYANHVHHYVCL